MKFLIFLVLCLASLSSFSADINFKAEDLTISLPSLGYGTSDRVRMSYELYPRVDGTLGLSVTLIGSYRYAHGRREIRRYGLTNFVDVKSRREGNLLYITVNGAEVIAAQYSWFTGWKISSAVKLEVTQNLVGPRKWVISSSAVISE